MIKNNDRWDESDLSQIAEYCVTSGMSASMSQHGREIFNEWVKTILEKYPSDGTVSRFLNIKNDYLGLLNLFEKLKIALKSILEIFNKDLLIKNFPE